MNAFSTKVFALCCLLVVAGPAGADDRFDSRPGFWSLDRLEWRLGDFRGGNRGHAILYRVPGSNRWRNAPGAAVAVGEGWVLGTDRHRGGYGIYRWNGRDWSRMPGTAVRIGGSYHQPWVVNDYGIRYVWNGYQWRETGLARGRDEDRRDVDRDFRRSWRGDERNDNRRRDRDDDRYRR